MCVIIYVGPESLCSVIQRKVEILDVNCIYSLQPYNTTELTATFEKADWVMRWVTDKAYCDMI